MGCQYCAAQGAPYLDHLDTAKLDNVDLELDGRHFLSFLICWKGARSKTWKKKTKAGGPSLFGDSGKEGGLDCVERR